MESNELIQLKQMMKNAPKMQFGAGVDYVQQRANMEYGLKMMPPEPGITFEDIYLDGVKVEIATPEKISGDSIIYYIHGGAFCLGSPFVSRSFISILAKISGFRVYSVDYRLAPEHPYPAAPDDCFTVYKALLDTLPGTKISIIGESAGGNLSLVTVIKAKEAGLPLPTSVTVYAPATEATGKIDRSKYADTDMSVPYDIEKKMAEIYSFDNDPSNPYISPLYGDYEGFPPLKIVVDSGEVLFEDSELLAEKAKNAGVVVEYEKWDDTFHTFPVMAQMIPEGMKVVKETIEFMKKYL